MKITVVGSGNVGAALGSRWAEMGHEITFASRNPEKDSLKKLTSKYKTAKAAPLNHAGDGADIIVLAVPWSAAESAIDQLGNIGQKVVIDCTNPIAEGMSGLTIGTTTSAGEMVQQWMPGAKVVKAFNSTGSGNMANAEYNDGKIAMPICGDDPDAKDKVKKLAEDLGFAVYDAGPLSSSRYLEPMALLWVTLAYKQGLGPDMAFQIIKRQAKNN
jgi:8-hydroxy-5-deazaflavin:NADPH oxidoreductase